VTSWNEYKRGPRDGQCDAYIGDDEAHDFKKYIQVGDEADIETWSASLGDYDHKSW
jgi:hypothetical protein